MPSVQTSHPYLDATRSPAERADDLLGRLNLQDKAGLLFHDMAMVSEVAALDTPWYRGRPSIRSTVEDLKVRHFNIMGPLGPLPEYVAWFNELQRTAMASGPGIPISFSTDPRHAFTNNVGTSHAAEAFSAWPESLGLAALRDGDVVRRFADAVRIEYRAAGIVTALHPQIDLATEPRWSRAGMTFGEDADLTSQMVRAYLAGLHGDGAFGTQSVSSVVKHFPGGGPQLDGEDPHFPYGKEQVYPSGAFDLHLQPFIAAIAAGARQMMPYYGMPVGTEYPEVAFGFNGPLITGLLREQLGFDGIVLSDWGLLTDAVIMGQYVPAHDWGLTDQTPSSRAALALDAGIDQFGGEYDATLVVDLVESGRISEERLDRSARRLLAEKFALGLFEDPFIDADRLAAVLADGERSRAGLRAQSEALVPLTGGRTLLGTEGVERECPRLLWRAMDGTRPADQDGVTFVDDAADADLVVLRLAAPYEERPGGFEKLFHAGSLEFPPSVVDEVRAAASGSRLLLVVALDRAAVLTPLVELPDALWVDFGASDQAVLDAVLDRVVPRGKLPFDLPRSDAAVAASPTDAPFATESPLFRFGHGREAMVTLPCTMSLRRAR